MRFVRLVPLLVLVSATAGCRKETVAPETPELNVSYRTASACYSPGAEDVLLGIISFWNYRDAVNVIGIGLRDTAIKVFGTFFVAGYGSPLVTNRAMTPDSNGFMMVSISPVLLSTNTVTNLAVVVSVPKLIKVGIYDLGAPTFTIDRDASIAYGTRENFTLKVC